MTEMEARGKALETMALGGYAMNWPGRQVVKRHPPIGDAVAIAVRDPGEPSFTVRDLGQPWPLTCWKIMLQPYLVRYRWLDPSTRNGYRESDLFVYSLTDAEREMFMRFCGAWDGLR